MLRYRAASKRNTSTLRNSRGNVCTLSTIGCHAAGSARSWPSASAGRPTICAIISSTAASRSPAATSESMAAITSSGNSPPCVMNGSVG
jgi:hypothetical protein